MASEGGAGATAAAAAARGDGRELVVPPPRPGVVHLCVEYPGYVGDEARVMETLGGVEGVGRQLQENPRQLALRLRPHDHNCHPLVGAREGSCRLLLKLSRPRQEAAGGGDSAGDAGGGGGWAAEVVASLPHTYRFSTPADYQYVAHDSRPVEEQGLEQQHGMNPPGFQQQPLLCAPPLFAKQPLFDYGFRGYMAAQAPGRAGAAAAAAGGGAGGSAKKKRGTGIMASFFDIEVPGPLPEGTLEAVAASFAEPLRLLRLLLEQRPVWPAAALHEAYAAAAAGGGGGGRSPADDLLPKLCYKFRNGPWKNAWTRRGFDPRADPAARQWQCAEYHLPSDWYSKIAERKKAGAVVREQQQAQGGGAGGQAAAAGGEEERQPAMATMYSQLSRFAAVPSTQSCSLQLCDIADSQVQRALADPANHAQHCSDTSGWLAPAAHDAIKQRIKERFQAVLDGRSIRDTWQQRGGAEAQQAQYEQQWQQAMEVDAAVGAAGAGAGGEVDELAQQAQQLHLRQRGQQGAAAAAAAAAAGGEAGILPTGFMTSLHDYLAQLPEERREESEDEGYQTEEAGAAQAQSEEEGPDDDDDPEEQ